MDLYEAFSLAPGAIVAAVGGGGKTSLVYGLAREGAARGLSAIVLSTTKFTRPAGPASPRELESNDADVAHDVARALLAGEPLVVSAGRGTHGRLQGFAPESVDALAQLGIGLISVEADGSAHRPFKAPAAHEPVIPQSATDVVVCVGLEVLGQPLAERYVHRPEIVARLADVAPGSTVTADVIVCTLTHAEGGRKGVPPGVRLHALLNGPTTPEHEKLGTHIAERLVYGGYYRAVVAVAHTPGDIRAVVR